MPYIPNPPSVCTGGLLLTATPTPTKCKPVASTWRGHLYNALVGPALLKCGFAAYTLQSTRTNSQEIRDKSVINLSLLLGTTGDEKGANCLYSQQLTANSLQPIPSHDFLRYKNKPARKQSSKAALQKLSIRPIGTGQNSQEQPPGTSIQGTNPNKDNGCIPIQK